MQTFATTHTPLAIALRAAGVKFVPPGIILTYSDGYLRKNGCASIADAEKMKLPPQKGFHFEIGDNHAALMAAWNHAQRTMDAGEPLDVPALTPEDVMRVACAVLSYRKLLFEQMDRMPKSLVVRDSDTAFRVLGPGCPPDLFTT